MDSPGLLADEALGARHLSRAAPQARRHLPQRVCLPIQSALLPARLVRDHARARLAPSADELLGYRRPRQSSQRRADSPMPAAPPKDSNRHAAGRFKPPSKLPRQPRSCGSLCLRPSSTHANRPPFQAQHEPRLPEANLGDQPLEAAAAVARRTGLPEVVINDLNPFLGPAEQGCTIDQPILQLGALLMLTDLAGGRLAHVNIGQLGAMR